MAGSVLFKTGNKTTNDLFVGKSNTITLDSELRELRVHDGVTPGGLWFIGNSFKEVPVTNDIDVASGNSFVKTLTENSTLTLSNPPTGRTTKIYLTIDYPTPIEPLPVITWPTISWVGGVEPSIDTSLAVIELLWIYGRWVGTVKFKAEV